MPTPVHAGPDQRTALGRRIKTATAQVAAMLPANAEEASLAARAVAAGAHHDACLREAVRQAVAAVPAEERVAADTEKREAKLEAAADRYAVVHPRRAQLIRRARGVPKECDFGPPGPALVRAIVSGDSQHLRAADALPSLAR